MGVGVLGIIIDTLPLARAARSIQILQKWAGSIAYWQIVSTSWIASFGLYSRAAIYLKVFDRKAVADTLERRLESREATVIP